MEEMKLSSWLFYILFFLSAIASLVLGTGLVITKGLYPYHSLAGFLLYIMFFILICSPFVCRALSSICGKHIMVFPAASMFLVFFLAAWAVLTPGICSSSANESMVCFDAKPLKYFEKGVVNTWMPVHESVSRFMSGTRMPISDDYRISESRLRSAAEKLEPADIIFMRKDWYLSNVATGGFWKHTAIHIGDLPELDDYFREACRKRYGLKLSDYIKNEFPEVYMELRLMNKDGKAAIIEALADGVCVSSLIESARSDSLAVIRPRLSRESKLDALLFCFRNYGKPYDFRFDYSTDSVFYCSELVSKAFESLGSESIFFRNPVSSAGPLLEPNDMVESFKAWENSSNPHGDVIIYFTEAMEAGANSEGGGGNGYKM